MPHRFVKGNRSAGTTKRALISSDMKYRDIEYTVVQGIGHQLWKWSVLFDTGLSIRGQAAIKSEAVAQAERAIDRALGAQKAEVSPPCARALKSRHRGER